MKKAVFTILLVIVIAASWAQSPQKMSYQAVVRDAGNNLVTNSPVGMRMSILQGAPGGTEVYKELLNPNPQTNVNGLVTVEIGTGIPLIGTFANINWANGPYFIKVETDPTGGTNYTITGTSQLLSVPYALYSKTAESYSEIDPKVGINTVNYLSKWGGAALIASSVYDNGNVGIGTVSPGQKLDVSGGSVRTTGQFISTLASGTPPLDVSSSTAVTNLNSDMVDGSHASAFALVSHNHDHNTLTDLQLAGSGVTYGHINNAAQTIEGNKTFSSALSAPAYTSTTATGTAPLTVTSTTQCTNLNADMVDGTHQAVHTQWLQILSQSTTTTLHTFINCKLETVGVSGRIRIQCTDNNGVKWVAYVNGVRSNGSLLINETKDFNINGGNDDLKIIITSSVNNLHQGVVEIHQVNGEYMSGIVWDTYSAN
jgi:hypothetical protein